MKHPILYIIPTKKCILGFVVEGRQVYVDKITTKQISEGTAIKDVISSGANMTKSHLLADILFTSEYERISILPASENTSAVPALNINSFGTKTIVKKGDITNDKSSLED